MSSDDSGDETTTVNVFAEHTGIEKEECYKCQLCDELCPIELNDTVIHKWVCEECDASLWDESMFARVCEFIGDSSTARHRASMYNGEHTPCMEICFRCQRCDSYAPISHLISAVHNGVCQHCDFRCWCESLSK